MDEDKTTGRQQTRDLKRLSPSASALSSRNMRLFMAGMILYMSCCGFFGVGLASRAYAQQRIETTPVDPTPDLEQQIAAVKKEELELAESLMKDFPNNANAFVVMGNVLEHRGI
ncbi:MAG: hypothetical protein P8Z79_16055 [Sedimentisphaerales bacterium]